MKGFPRTTPYDVGHADPRVPYAPEDDVGETISWCENCKEDRRWVKTHADVSRSEELSEMPSIYHALEGETGWRCAGCGEFRRDLIAEEGYEFNATDSGYQVDGFTDDETPLVKREDDVTPPERMTERGLPKDLFVPSVHARARSEQRNDSA